MVVVCVCVCVCAWAGGMRPIQNPQGNPCLRMSVAAMPQPDAVFAQVRHVGAHFLYAASPR